MLRLTIAAAARRSAIAAVSRSAPRVATVSRASVRASAFSSSARTVSRATERLHVRTVAAALAAAGVATVALTQDQAVAAAKVNYDEIRRAIAEMLDENPDYDDGSYGPLFVRLAWHASGTYSVKDGSGGSDGARMRFAPEAFWGANAGLSLARNQMQRLKIRFPEISYADLWTLAGAVAIEHMGGPRIPWRAGRTDEPNGAKSPADGRLPDALQGASHIREIFYRMGFNDREIVALCGAHCLGRCHADRSGFTGPWTRAPTTFSNDYFKLLLNEKWTRKEWTGPEQYQDATGELMMLPADLALVHDPAFRAIVTEYAADEGKFRSDFAAAFGKLLELGCESKVAPSPVSVSTVAVVGGGAALAIGTAILGYRFMSGSPKAAAAPAAAPAAAAAPAGK